MRKGTAAAGSSLFFALEPGIFAGAMPWWLTHWRVRHLPAYGAPLRAVGVILLAAGAVVLVRAFARFVAEGVGTPAPIAPTRHLVVGGLYSYVRNPMNANKVQARLWRRVPSGTRRQGRYRCCARLALLARFVPGIPHRPQWVLKPANWTP